MIFVAYILLSIVLHEGLRKVIDCEKKSSFEITSLTYIAGWRPTSGGRLLGSLLFCCVPICKRPMVARLQDCGGRPALMMMVICMLLIYRLSCLATLPICLKEKINVKVSIPRLLNNVI